MSRPRITMDRPPVYKPLKPRLLSMPQKGTYVVLRIDPVGTLEALDDLQVKESASNIQTQNYVGFVEEVLNDLDPKYPFRAIRVRLLHQGLPKENLAEGIEPHMCFAVRPATDHPHSTRPLIPSKPLPWDNCYHHTYFPGAVLRVRYSRAYDHESWWLKPSELRWFDSVQRKDAAKREHLRAEFQKAHPGTSIEDTIPRAPPSDDASSLDADGPDLETPGAVAPPGGDVQQDDTAEELIAMFAMMDQASKANRPHDTMTLATVSYDIDSVSTWGAPEGFFKEQNQLLNIEKDFKARLIAKAEQANDTYGSTAEQIKQMYSRRAGKPGQSTEELAALQPSGSDNDRPQGDLESLPPGQELDSSGKRSALSTDATDGRLVTQPTVSLPSEPSKKKRKLPFRPLKLISFGQKKARNILTTMQSFINKFQGKKTA